MGVVIEVLDHPTPARLYVKGYDPDARDGRGIVLFTTNLSEALVLATMVEAVELWLQQSRVQPFRPDGKPNRPLSAYTCTFENV